MSKETFPENPWEDPDSDWVQPMPPVDPDSDPPEPIEEEPPGPYDTNALINEQWPDAKPGDVAEVHNNGVPIGPYVRNNGQWIREVEVKGPGPTPQPGSNDERPDQVIEPLWRYIGRIQGPGAGGRGGGTGWKGDTEEWSGPEEPSYIGPFWGPSSEDPSTSPSPPSESDRKLMTFILVAIGSILLMLACWEGSQKFLVLHISPLFNSPPLSPDPGVPESVAVLDTSTNGSISPVELRDPNISPTPLPFSEVRDPFEMSQYQYPSTSLTYEEEEVFGAQFDPPPTTSDFVPYPTLHITPTPFNQPVQPAVAMVSTAYSEEKGIQFPMLEDLDRQGVEIAPLLPPALIAISLIALLRRKLGRPKGRKSNIRRRNRW